MRSTRFFPSDGNPGNEAINSITGVAVYPADDGNGTHQVHLLSREIVDTFIQSHHGKDVENALLRGIARRLTAKNGGETLQNIRMLSRLDTIIHNTTDDELITQKYYQSSDPL